MHPLGLFLTTYMRLLGSAMDLIVGVPALYSTQQQANEWVMKDVG